MGHQTETTLLQTVSGYWDQRAEGYSMDVQEQLAGETGENWLGTVEQLAPATDYPRVLDIGCGPGFFEALLGSHGYQVTGIDCSEGMLRQARQNIASVQANAAVGIGDAISLDFKEESFDLIVSRNLLWNLEYPAEAYENWSKLLRPGGRLILMDGNYYLHYNDPAYAPHSSGSDHKHMEGIDVSVIDRVALDLPLSRHRRPEWDFTQLKALGMEPSLVRVWKNPAANGGEVVYKFILTAVKE